MKGSCPICGETKSNLWDHLTRIHQMEGENRRKWLREANVGTRNVSQIGKKCEAFHLKHPFTCMVSGMTGCGKTTWVKRLLEHREHTIRPTPQRIIWFYSIWQPAYNEMQQNIPAIQFVRGIPPTIENDDYFDVSVRNLVVIDDQMSTASKDKQVINMFTQGSHHRNLSVIYLVQNLFHQGKGNRDISLNCHYLVIFKNPRDKLQVLTLAKQMYPRKTHVFLDKYEEAVSRPFGYLFIDLKSTTPDHCRLRTNVLLESEETSDELSRELLKHFKYQDDEKTPVAIKMRNLQEQMGDILRNDTLNSDQKVRQYAQLQNNFSQYRKQEINNIQKPNMIIEEPIDNVQTEPENYNIPHQDVPLLQTPQIQPTPQLAPLPGSPFSETSERVDEPFVSPGIVAAMTPPLTVSHRKSSKKSLYKMKNYLDSDSHKTVDPYASAHRLRRSSRILRRAYLPFH